MSDGEWVTRRARFVLRCLIPYVYLNSLWCYWPHPFALLWAELRGWWYEGTRNGKQRADILRGMIRLPNKPRTIA